METLTLADCLPSALLRDLVAYATEADISLATCFCLAVEEWLAQQHADTETEQEGASVLTCERCGQDYPSYTLHFHVGSIADY